MADVRIDADTDGFLNQKDGLHGIYWTSPSVGYLVSMENGLDIEVWKTSDSGATWATQDAANEPNSQTNTSLNTWWDQEAPGNSGTILHIAWVESNTNSVHYIQFNTASGTWGTDRTVDSLTISVNDSFSDIAVTVSKSGRVYVCTRGDYTQDTENTDHSMRSSSDGFATNNESEASPYSADEEIVSLYPGVEVDEDDIVAVVYDSINKDLEFWKFDASANSWAITSIDPVFNDGWGSAGAYKGFNDGAIRHSDGHLLVIYWNNTDHSTGDFRAVDIDMATPTVTQKTDIITNRDDSFLQGILINQQNDDVYAAYAGSDTGGETLFATVQCYYKLSTDDMGSWSTQQAYGTLDDDIRIVSGGRTVGNAGGRWMPVFWNQDLRDIWVNDGNDIEIAAAAAGVIITPGVLVQILAEYAPTASTPRLVTPNTLALDGTEYEPTAILGTLITPDVLALDDVEYAPVVVTPTTVTPAVLPHVLTEYAPTVTTPVVITPAKLAHLLTEFVPAVVLGQTVTPGVLGLSDTEFAPTVSTPVVVTPNVIAQLLSTLVPSLTITGNVNIVPGKLAHLLTEYAPTIISPGTVTPDTLAQVLTEYAPTASVPVLTTPDVVSLLIGLFAPSISTPVSVVPGVLAQILTTLVPGVSVSSGTVITPNLIALVISTLVPSAVTPIVMVPGAGSLVLGVFSPSVETSRVIVPDTLAHILTELVASVTTGQTITPDQLDLLISTYGPRAVYTWIEEKMITRLRSLATQTSVKLGRNR